MKHNSPFLLNTLPPKGFFASKERSQVEITVGLAEQERETLTLEKKKKSNVKKKIIGRMNCRTFHILLTHT